MEEKSKTSGITVPKPQEIEKRDLTWKSKSIDKISGALCRAQKSMNGVIKNTQGYNWQYADLAAVIEATLPLLNEEGISVFQGSNQGNPGEFHITTTFMHESGQWLRTWVKIPVQKLTAQEIGTAVTYGRRYALAAMACIAQKDDDGQEVKNLQQQRS